MSISMAPVKFQCDITENSWEERAPIASYSRGGSITLHFMPLSKGCHRKGGGLSPRAWETLSGADSRSG